MNIDDLRALEGLYRDSHPGFTLMAIEPIVLPVNLVTVEVLADEIQDFNQVYEFVLKFLDKGYNTASRLAAAMGFDETHLIQILASIAQQGYIHVRSENQQEILELSRAGEDALRDLKVRKPTTLQLKFVWDRASWSLTSWDAGLLLNPSQTENSLGDSYALAKAMYSAKKTQLADFSPVLLNENLSVREGKTLSFTIHQTVRVVRRQDLNAIGSLLVKRNNFGDIGLVIDIQGKRQFAIEREIAHSGGLEGLGLNYEFVDASELASPQRQQLPLGKPEEIELDGNEEGFVDVYLHAAYLEDALENAKNRLLIISPWITDSVVNEKFLERFERLLRRENFSATIAWHYEDKRVQRDSPKAIKSLLELSKKYKTFNFIKIGSTHAKILLKDSEYYISSSFNWLSYKGDRKTELRMEIGEKRTEPAVVNSRYRALTEDISHRGIATTDRDVPYKAKT